MGWGRAALGVMLLATVTACSLVRSTTPPLVGGRQEGVASWYGPGFHGRRTANGEVYDQYELTAAHQSLALGTRVMVTSLTNGRSVEVRINDRGPFVGGRVIDLSFAAARVIGMVGPGTMPVRVEVLDAAVQVAARRAAPPLAVTRPRAPETSRRSPQPAAEEPAPPAAEPEATYTVQVATLSDAAKAEHLRSRIALRFPEAHVSPIDAGDDRFYRVGIGPYTLRRVALARAELVNRLGYPAVISEEPPR